MSLLARLLIVTFIESLATTLIERGIFFFSHDRLAFTDTENLGMALAFGVMYVVGALGSHGLARRFGEKRVLVLAVIAQMAVHATLVVWHESATLVVLNAVLGGLNGLKWPVIESYVSAGRTPAEQAKTVGRFNLSWAPAVPVGLVLAGPLIAWSAQSFFAVAGALNLISLVLIRPLDARPTHLPPDHPERPTEETLARLRGLLAASRSAMFASYSLMWILAAMLPGVYTGLGVAVTVATSLSGLIDVFRTMAFLVLQFYHGWHNRSWPVLVVLAGLPGGFLLVLYSPNVAMVLAGEVIFGLAAGMTYHAALYYAMIVKNAAVEAGGAHEGLIGAGFAVGPIAGLAGGVLAGYVGGAAAGMLLGVSPIVLGCSAAAAWFLVRTRRQAPRQRST